MPASSQSPPSRSREASVQPPVPNRPNRFFEEAEARRAASLFENERREAALTGTEAREEQGQAGAIQSDLFSRLDTNHDGVIDRAEFEAGFASSSGVPFGSTREGEPHRQQHPGTTRAQQLEALRASQARAASLPHAAGEAWPAAPPQLPPPMPPRQPGTRLPTGSRGKPATVLGTPPPVRQRQAFVTTPRGTVSGVFM